MEGLERRWFDPSVDPPSPALEPAAPPAPRARWVIAGLLVVAAALASGALLLSATAGGPAPLPLDAAPIASAAIATSGTALVVDVEGAVRRPGLYRLPPGSRVADAIAAAGGFDASADVAAASVAINLAQPLRDAMKVQVPGRGASTTGPPQAVPVPSSRLIDLNRATPAELDTLPGIGPATATKIVASRETDPFTRPDDLVTRKLVSNATWEKVRDLVTVGG